MLVTIVLSPIKLKTNFNEQIIYYIYRNEEM